MLTAYFVRSLTDRALAQRFRDAAPLVEQLFVDLRIEAELLLNSLEGLQTSVVLGQRSPDAAIALIDHQLARIFR